MGNASHAESQQTAKNQSIGSSAAYNQATGSSQGFTGGQSSGTQDVWGAQSPALAQLYSQAQQLMSGQGAAGQGAAGVAQNARNAWADQLTPGGNPYFERSVQGAIDSATTGFNRNVLPELEARGVGVGQYGGQRDSLARGQAAGDFGDSLQRNVGQMYAGQYQGDRALAGQALGQSGMVQNMQTAPLTTAGSLIGGPTVLGQQQASNFGQQSAQNSSWGSALSNNQSMGTSQGTSSDDKVGIMSKG
jgi:hypothetical protein